VLIYTKLTCVELIFGALTFVEPTFRMLISWELIFIELTLKELTFRVLILR
jgi:hypothetical protein